MLRSKILAFPFNQSQHLSCGSLGRVNFFASLPVIVHTARDVHNNYRAGQDSIAGSVKPVFTGFPCRNSHRGGSGRLAALEVNLYPLVFQPFLQQPGRFRAPGKHQVGIVTGFGILCLVHQLIQYPVVLYTGIIKLYTA